MTPRSCTLWWPVAAYSQVDLGQGVKAAAPPRVEQDRHLQAVSDWDRQRLQQLAAHPPLAADRLNDRSQFGPFQVEQRPGHQLSHPTALRPRFGRVAVVVGELPVVEPLNQLDVLVG